MVAFLINLSNESVRSDLDYQRGAKVGLENESIGSALIENMFADKYRLMPSIFTAAKAIKASNRLPGYL